MEKWEYNTTQDSCSLGYKKLDEFGQEGWELVSMTYAPDRDYVLMFYYVFKRKLALA